MQIGIIGLGSIGKAFARHVAKAGYEVIISNSRGPESLAEMAYELGSTVRAGTVEEAGESEVIFISLPWNSLEGILGRISWEGKTLIDPTNPILPGFKMADLAGKTSAEVAKAMAPGAAYVKAFNTLPEAVLAADPHEENGKRVIFYAGDSAAKVILKDILDRIGFAGVDVGDEVNGGKLMEFGVGSLIGLNLIKLS